MQQQDTTVETVQPFQFMTVAELYEYPEETTSYVVEGLLPTSGLSILAGKPKAGKSTLARQLAVAVAQGHLFLERATDQGTVLYLALEEKPTEVQGHFKQLGLLAGDPVRIWCGSIRNRSQAVPMLEAALQNVKDAKLVIIDPLFRFVGVRDSNDYMQVNDALEKILTLARQYGAHLLTVHHLKKKDTEDTTDGVLGSTAIVAACDTFLALEASSKRQRTLCTRQRYGRDMEPTELVWNQESRQLSLGITCEEAQCMATSETQDRIRAKVYEYVSAKPECTREDIMNDVQGKTTVMRQVLQSLIGEGVLVRSGTGIKGDAHKYCVADVPYKEAFPA